MVNVIVFPCLNLSSDFFQRGVVQDGLWLVLDSIKHIVTTPVTYPSRPSRLAERLLALCLTP